MEENNLKIVFDNPSRSFVPGSVITGKVISTVINFREGRHIILYAKGEATTNFCEKFCNHVTYFDYSIPLWFAKTKKDKPIFPGVYTYPFEFEIPEECPVNFCGSNGSIDYTLEVEMDTEFFSILRTWASFYIVPKLESIITKEAAINFLSVDNFQKHDFLKIQIPKRHFANGDSIPVTLDFLQTCKDIKIEISIFTKITYFGKKKKKTTDLIVDEVNTKGVEETINGLQLPASQTFKLPIDNIIPSIDNCSVIKVENFIKISVTSPDFQCSSNIIPVTLIPSIKDSFKFKNGNNRCMDCQCCKVCKKKCKKCKPKPPPRNLNVRGNLGMLAVYCCIGLGYCCIGCIQGLLQQ